MKDNKKLFTVNDQLIVDGRSDIMGNRFNLKSVEDISFDLYENRKKIGAYTPTVEPSPMEGEWVINYEGFYFDYSDVFLGFPSKEEPVFYEYEEVMETEGYRHYIDDYLLENNISQTPYDIQDVYQLPEFGEEVFIIHSRDNQRDNVGVDTKYISWSENDYKENEIGFFEVVYLIDETSGKRQITSSFVAQFTPNLGFPI